MKAYQTGFLFGHLGHALGVGLGGTVGGWGVKKKNFPKFNQIWVCELLTLMAHATGNFFLVPTPWGPEEGPKGQIS